MHYKVPGELLLVRDPQAQREKKAPWPAVHFPFGTSPFRSSSST